MGGACRDGLGLRDVTQGRSLLSGYEMRLAGTTISSPALPPTRRLIHHRMPLHHWHNEQTRAKTLLIKTST